MLFVLLLAAATAVAACDTEAATFAVVHNGYNADTSSSDGGASAGIVVYRAWWSATYFADPVTPGSGSVEQRTVPGTDFAYALLAPGWNPSSTTPPTRLVPLRSKARLTVGRGDLLHVIVSDDAFAGNCASGQPLSQEDADFITQRIFPGPFADLVYDAKTCTTKPAASDASTD
jgi:hypothetical protein